VVSHEDSFYHSDKRSLGNGLVKTMVREILDREVWVQALAVDLASELALCSWARHLTFTVPLFTQVYKWVLVNLMLGVTLRWTTGE